MEVIAVRNSTKDSSLRIYLPIDRPTDTPYKLVEW